MATISSATLYYRDAQVSDLPAIVEIYNSTIASRMVTADTEPVSIESKMNWFREHSASKRPLWVIEDQNQNCIGWVSFQSFYGRPAYNATVEISIYLHPAQRGKGVGKQVLQYCLKQAPTYGIKTILAYIFAHNLPSIKLFEAFEFKTWANFPNIALLDDQERSLIILGKRIV